MSRGDTGIFASPLLSQMDGGEHSSGSHIRPLPAGLAASLLSAPQVPDVATAVAELVSNSLDAGATRVCVWLTALGPDDIALTVDDDGAGVSPGCFAHLAAAPGCTSKLRTAAQLAAGPLTLGFKVRSAGSHHHGVRAWHGRAYPLTAAAGPACL
jgi:hypothetical protein